MTNIAFTRVRRKRYEERPRQPKTARKSWRMKR